MTPKARILAIDDQLYFRSFIEGLLAEEGYEVATAEGGPAALQRLANEGPFDLVLTDLVMPGMDGVETVTRIIERWPEQPVIVVSGVGDVRAAVSAMKLGAADYLLKPIDREGLVRSIEAVLERCRIRQENDRLVNENLEFMGLLALFERALPLFGLATPEAVGAALLELLCRQARARGGLFWIWDPVQREFTSFAAHGCVRLAEEQIRWDGGTDGLQRAVRTGEPQSDPAAGALFVPCLDPRGLVGVAALSGFGDAQHTPAMLGALRKLAEVGAVALGQIRRLDGASLRDAETGTLTRAFLDDVARIELRRAARFGRMVALISIELEVDSTLADAPPALAEALRRVPALLEQTVRGTDLVASHGARQFFLLISDASPLGAAVLKRRLGAQLRELLLRQRVEAECIVGVACFPADGERLEDLVRVAAARGRAARTAQPSPIDPELPLARAAEHLLARGRRAPSEFVTEAAELLVREVSLRPEEHGVLFIAPGAESSAVLSTLTLLGSRERATEIFVATAGETLPRELALAAVPLPPGVPAASSWIVHYGEGPPYALVAGPPDGDGTRLVFHSGDDALVEQLVLRLRSEVGLGQAA